MRKHQSIINHVVTSFQPAKSDHEDKSSGRPRLSFVLIKHSRVAVLTTSYYLIVTVNTFTLVASRRQRKKLAIL